MTRHRAWWAGYLAIGLARELRAVRSDDHDATLTAFTRWAFMLRTQPGRWAWALAWPAAAAWVWEHVREHGADVGPVLHRCVSCLRQRRRRGTPRPCFCGRQSSRDVYQPPSAGGLLGRWRSWH